MFAQQKQFLMRKVISRLRSLKTIEDEEAASPRGYNQWLKTKNQSSTD
jgi:hypothetical protein